MRARSLTIGAAALACFAALAQIPSGSGSSAETDAAAAVEKKTPAPAIPVELQLEYFRTDGVLAHLKAELTDAQNEYEAAVKAVVKACGENAAPVLTQDKRHLFCVAQTPKK